MLCQSNDYQNILDQIKSMHHYKGIEFGLYEVLFNNKMIGKKYRLTKSGRKVKEFHTAQGVARYLFKSLNPLVADVLWMHEKQNNRTQVD